MGAVEASPEIVHLGEDGRGHERFSTREMIATEARMADTSVTLADRGQHRVSATMQVTVLHARGLGDEQEAAFRHVTANKDLALVVGYAGTGKSTMLGAAREAWETSGYTVRGATLSGIAAENLEAGSGIGSRTIASLEHAWGQGRDELTSRDVLVIDEAGMVGSRQMDRVMSRAAETGAKLVLVGDPEQLQAIEAGAAFRALAERHGAAEITTVRRQREEWQRGATKELATGRTAEALGRYAEAGMVEAHATRAEARAAVVAGWDAARQAAPEQSSVILAYTRADVRELNELARGRMREAGVLGEDRRVSTERGERAFAEGDRIMFLRNERGLGVKNGTLGIVERVGDGGMAVRLDGADRREVTFDLKDYAYVDHGYAATVHKAQGVTVDRVHVLATPHMDRHAAYVGLTRHREGVSLHYGRDDFRDGKDLAWSLGRERAKDTTLDYATGPGHGSDHQAGFAERRGIVPRSEIIVSTGTVERPAHEATTHAKRAFEREAPQRGMFSGLKLGGGADRGQERVRDSAEGQAQAQRSPFAGLRVGQEQGGAAPASGQQSGGLERAVEGYARAFGDAERMRTARLPVLAHQELALQRAGERLDKADRQVGQDLRSALERNPGLAADGNENRAALTAAIDHERRVREDPGLRAERYVERWGKLEEAHDADRYGRGEDDAKQAMRVLAGEIKRDPQAESVMKIRREELGIEHGSRLSRVVEAQSEREAMRLGRSQGLSR